MDGTHDDAPAPDLGEPLVTEARISQHCQIPVNRVRQLFRDLAVFRDRRPADWRYPWAAVQARIFQTKAA